MDSEYSASFVLNKLIEILQETSLLRHGGLDNFRTYAEGKDP